MRHFLLFSAIWTLVICSTLLEGEPDDEYIPLVSNFAHLSDDDAAHIALTASDSDILYHFFSQRNPKKSVKVRTTTITTLRNSAFNKNKDTLFIIHGWKNNNESDVNYHIREAIVEGHDINVFVVDWSVLAGRSYTVARSSVKKVGNYVGNFIRALKRYYRIELSKVKFVGHSLGAHVCGNAGQFLGGKVDRITGLDPAGPLFTVANTDNRLDPTDAQYVQVIHTNDGFLGFAGILGHSDFYPNGGRSQSGCGLDIVGTCAHSRAYAYYKESLNSEKFVAKRCSSYDAYTRWQCTFARKAIMGRFEPDKTITGTYYLDTNGRYPYAKG